MRSAPSAPRDRSRPRAIPARRVRADVDEEGSDTEGTRARWAASGRAVVAVLAVIVIAAAVFLVRWFGWAPTDLTPSTVPPAVPGTPSAAGAGPPAPARGPAEIVVDVVGAVRRPGIVRLPEGARVVDAVEGAGGARPDAELSSVNLAQLVTDGLQIRVATRSEARSGAPGPAGSSAAAGSGAVSLNSADLAALDSLPGIGPVLAQRILDWRQEHGAFRSVDELGEVSGIGDRLLTQLKDKVTL